MRKASKNLILDYERTINGRVLSAGDIVDGAVMEYVRRRKQDGKIIVGIKNTEGTVKQQPLEIMKYPMIGTNCIDRGDKIFIANKVCVFNALSRYNVVILFKSDGYHTESYLTTIFPLVMFRVDKSYREKYKNPMSLVGKKIHKLGSKHTITVLDMEHDVNRNNWYCQKALNKYGNEINVNIRFNKYPIEHWMVVDEFHS